MRKTGTFIVPTGIGASIGGFAGDASCFAGKFSEYFDLIVNPNVVNAGCFSGINEKMLYVEGYSLDEFFKGNLNLKKTKSNKIGVIFDKAITNDVLNIHINTINAVRTVYGINIIGYEITEQEAGIGFEIDRTGVSTGNVKNLETLIKTGENLIEKGAEALAVVCAFEDCEDEAYENGIGVDPIGGVEAIISHGISKALKVPCAHSPAFQNYEISSKIVDSRAAAEYITPTFLPCILLGLSNAPHLTTVSAQDLNVSEVEFLVMPYNSLGSVPIFECLNRGIKVFAVGENKTVLNVEKQSLACFKDVIFVDTYEDCLKYLIQNL